MQMCEQFYFTIFKGYRITSFRGHKWLQTNMCTIPDSVFGTVFHTLSNGVFCFIWSSSPRNHFLRGFLRGHWKLLLLVVKAKNPSKMDHATRRKGMKNRAREWCQTLRTFLFYVTFMLGKMCS